METSAVEMGHSEMCYKFFRHSCSPILRPYTASRWLHCASPFTEMLICCHATVQIFVDSRLMAFGSNHCGAFFPFFGVMGYFSRGTRHGAEMSALVFPQTTMWGWERSSIAPLYFMGANDKAGGFGLHTAVWGKFWDEEVFDTQILRSSICCVYIV